MELLTNPPIEETLPMGCRENYMGLGTIHKFFRKQQRKVNF